MENKLELPFGFTIIPNDEYSSLKAGQTISVKDMTGVFLCTEGHIDVSIADKRYRLEKNDLFLFIPSAFIHFYHISPDFKGVVLHSDMDFFLSEANKILDVKMQLFMMSHLQLSLFEDEASNVLKLMLSINQRIQLENQNDMNETRRIILSKLIKSLVETLGLELINIFLSRNEVAEPKKDRNDEVLHNFVKSLSNNYKHNRSVTFYAGEQCLSYSYFSELVKEKTGMTAKEWIVRYVINDAKNMLKYTTDSIKEISIRLNFPNQSFFGKYFKSYVGLSPKDYRLMAIKERGNTDTKLV